MWIATRARRLPSATLTYSALPVGIVLILIGILTSILLPRRMRQQRDFLDGSIECIDCAHPLLAQQRVCPECGTMHGTDAR